MKKLVIHILSIFWFSFALMGCNAAHKGEETPSSDKEKTAQKPESGLTTVHLSNLKVKSLGITVDTLPKRALSDVVEANGQLEVPPQHEATVTTMVGANITSIKVIEGDKVHKGQVLGYLSHPNLINLQTQYGKALSRLQYLEQEMQRQQKLYEEEVGAGKTYQETRANYRAMKSEVKGYAAQLQQLHLSPSRIAAGEVYQNAPVVSPIDGYIEKVLIQVGQYVAPEKELFKIVNNEHIHADLMVFEKDVHKVKKDQNLAFTVESVPGKVLHATIYSVGKQFEQNPKAVHVHAEIKQKEDFLIPGMYINGKIQTKRKTVNALPIEAIVEEEGRPYIFLAQKLNDKKEWRFIPTAIKTGLENDGWIEVRLLEKLPNGAQIAMNNAYYIISEMKKGSTEHGH